MILRAEGICKSFYGNKVLDNVQIELQPGRVHALCGENGAGKSTLLKIITGLYTKDSGSIYMDGKEITVNNVEDAKKYGIHVVPQEMQMLRELTVAENIFLGNPPRNKMGLVDWKTMIRRANEVKAMLGVHGEKINVTDKTGDLSMGSWQLIEIMRAFTGAPPRVIAFDEPTSSLSDSEVEALFALINDLRDKGVAIVYVSHRMKEIFQLCDDISVFRDGRYVGSRIVKDTTNDELVAMMIGRGLNLYGERKDPATIKEDVALRCENFSHGKFYQDVNIQVKKGEILGMYGLVGAGRTEFVRGVFGADKIDSGEVYVKGEKVAIKKPQDAIKRKIAFLTEDRKGQGLVLNLDVRTNLILANMKGFSNGPFLDKARIQETGEANVKALKIKTPSLDEVVGQLSGGNQQKVVIGKWVNIDADIFIFDEPTRGIDVGAKIEVYRVMNDLVKEGKCVIMVSSELPEILAMSDHVVVMREGKVMANIERGSEHFNSEDIMKAAWGGELD